MDELANDAREASQLIQSMRATLKSAQAEIVEVLDDLNNSEDGSQKV